MAIVFIDSCIVIDYIKGKAAFLIVIHPPTCHRFIPITANPDGTVTMFEFSDWMEKK